MKKGLSILILITSSFLAIGQGNAFFDGGIRGIWDDFSSAQPQLAPTMNVAFLFGIGTPLVVSQVANSVPTNGVSVSPLAWGYILSDPNFMLATNLNALGMPAVTTNAATGGWSYGSGSFGVAGSTALTTYQILVFGWDKTYATPQAAAIAGSALGWAAPFNYTMQQNPTGIPLSMPASGLVSFGVVAVPEPSSLALIGLGVISLTLFRRREDC